MTAVEWLLQELEKVNYHPTEAMIMYAMKLEKQQIIDAAERWKGTIFAEKYYEETYGSKESDGNFKQFSLYEHKETITSTDTIISSKIELSDEEIDKISKKEIWYNEDKRHWVIEGMKLYREQLKLKVSNQPPLK